MLKNFTVVNILNTRSDSVANYHGNTIRFNPQTAAELGYPQYVQILVYAKGKQFAIRSCSEKDEMAVPFCKTSEKKKVVINHAVIAGLIRKMAGWTLEDNWNMPGVFFPDENAIVYAVESAVVPQPRGGGWAVKRQKEAEAAARAAEEMED